MSTKIKVGNVVDLVTNTGMQQGIVIQSDNETIAGHLVNSNDHKVITGDFNVYDYEIISTYDEKAFVIPGYNNDIVLFKDTNGLYICERGNETSGRYVKSIPGALKVARDMFTHMGETEAAQEIDQAYEFNTKFLADIFEMPTK